MKQGQFNQLPLEERFWGSTAKAGDDECWLWIGHVGSAGYGKIKRNYKTIHAHRISYELAYGVIPKGLIVCHHCDVPRCVNPRHLFVGTNKDNTTDMIQKGRHRPAFGERHWKATLTDADVVAIRASADRGIDLAERYGVTKQCISKIRNADRRQREKTAS